MNTLNFKEFPNIQTFETPKTGNSFCFFNFPDILRCHTKSIESLKTKIILNNELMREILHGAY